MVQVKIDFNVNERNSKDFSFDIIDGAMMAG